MHDSHQLPYQLHYRAGRRLPNAYGQFSSVPAAQHTLKEGYSPETDESNLA